MFYIYSVTLPFILNVLPLRYFLALNVQTGKLNMSQTFQDWSCSNGCSPPLNCRLAICTSVAFPQAFSGSANVSVHNG